ncbi:MAG TPA: O-antigen ligase family protein [Solirubrobacteraceae bacterium]
MTATTPAPRLRMVPDGGAERRRALRAPALTAVVAVAALALSLDEGTSEVTTRSVAAIIICWGTLLAVAFSLWPRGRVPAAAVACGAGLAAFALFTGLSAFWAPSAERAFLEFDRVALYAALFGVAVLAARPGDGRAWADGLGLAIGVVGVLALAQRLLPGLLPETDIPRLLPAAGSRLSYPLGYWNGLGIFLALGLPLLLRTASAPGAVVWRALAVVPVPAMAGAVYLTSSRGGVAVAAVAAIAFLAFAPRRFATLQALAVAAAGSALAVAVISGHPELVDGTPGSVAAHDEGPGVAAAVALICVLTGAAYGALAALAPPRMRLPRAAVAGIAVVAVLIAGVAVAAADPAERFRDFKQPPPELTSNDPDFVRTHLLSGAGSGRWQFWDAALDQWSDHRLAGQGAGSFEAWWAQHGTLDWFVRNAHSLWLETLGALGVVGLLLLAAPFLVAIVAGARRLRSPAAATGDGEESRRSVVAALLAVAVAFVFGMSIDWAWQIPAVAGIGVVTLGLLTGAATAPRARAADARRRSTATFGARAACVLVAWALIVAQAIPLLVTNEVSASQDAAARGDLAEAFDRAESARSIQPWAATPHLQLALIREAEGDLADARRHLADALARDDSDWRLRLVAARLATKAGDIDAARAALAEARRLNPRSPALRSPPS